MSNGNTLDESVIRDVVNDVLRKLGQAKPLERETPKPKRTESRSARSRPASSEAGRDGVFDCALAAAAAAQEAYRKLSDEGVAARQSVVQLVKTMCERQAQEWGKLELEETRIGRLDHKIEKLQIVKLVPGVEWLRPYAQSGDHGITLEEFAPFGVVAAITPSTHSIPTLSGNVVNAVAAGNTLVINPHPGAARCAATAVEAFNRAIVREIGIPNIVTCIREPSLDSFDALGKSEHVAILCITGGPAVVKAALRSGKRAICAGPGNPPVVIDETADVEKAAAQIVAGGAYDNNLLCIGEKEVFVVEAVADRFFQALRSSRAAEVGGSALDRLTAAAFDFREGEGAGCPDPVLKRDLIGKDPRVLADAAGIRIAADTQLLFAETQSDHPFVVEEQMMPFLPIVRVKNFEDAVEGAKKAEHGYRHSAIIHSKNVDRMTVMAREIGPTLFIKNGPCMAGLGLGGEGYLSYSIATTTGEGITTPQTFTRIRRCVMVDSLRIF